MSKKSRLPQSGILRKLVLIFFINLSFIPPFVTALMRIPVAKFTHKQQVKNITRCVNVSVKRALNTQEDNDGYFSNFDSDSKLAVIDNAANVNVWNCKEDFVEFRPLCPNMIPANVQTIGDGALPSGIGDVPVIFKDNNYVKHNLLLKKCILFSKFRSKFNQCC